MFLLRPLQFSQPTPLEVRRSERRFSWHLSRGCSLWLQLAASLVQSVLFWSTLGAFPVCSHHSRCARGVAIDPFAFVCFCRRSGSVQFCAAAPFAALLPVSGVVAVFLFFLSELSNRRSGAHGGDSLDWISFAFENFSSVKFFGVFHFVRVV